MKVTNRTGIPLTLAVWAVHDDYDYIKADKYISATTLMKPIRQIVLGYRQKPEEREQLDVADLISSSWGSALHGSIEAAWMKYRTNLKRLGYPDHIIERVRINPTAAEVAADPNIIAIYMEQRGTLSLNGWTVGGKFDFVGEGQVQDNKSTTAYTWLYGTKDEDYKLQLSIYRAIHRTIITEDTGQVNFLFTDWKKSDARSNPKYPQSRLESKTIPLLSIPETENWIMGRLELIDRYMDTPENELPRCTDEELWRSEPVHKYYADPNKTDGRSTKNFEHLWEANQFMASKGGKGVVKTIPGQVKRCEYCAVFNQCTQKNEYFPTNEVQND
ncbi:hypothetical protein CPT_Piffle_062 [Stenotrophomonas phage Piffle]|uniref:PD-(D/E)XK endonuclease-like domain-containing protein n=1 Tax=Stenotrophomonas phage Piffle TaxID=2859656 RepID=A0AAE8BJB5_9CAUD|nr:exonuclease [Stenotrophomonas phage Piffle]QYW01916.1 hypothetical protein CPT_Piffle_062 [Stenotrophomonas phage Piffle]